MRTKKRILMAVDKSLASRRAVDYVVDIVGGKPDFHIGLLHLELPPRMLEWGGSEDPGIEEKVSSERAVDYRQLEGKAIQKGQDLLQGMKELLVQNRIDVTAQIVQFEEPLDPKHIARHILRTAGKQDYGTVVVGRQAFSGLARLFQHHVAEELVRVGTGFAIWIVECMAGHSTPADA